MSHYNRFLSISCLLPHLKALTISIFCVGLPLAFLGTAKADQYKVTMEDDPIEVIADGNMDWNMGSVENAGSTPYAMISAEDDGDSATGFSGDALFNFVWPATSNPPMLVKVKARCGVYFGSAAPVSFNDGLGIPVTSYTTVDSIGEISYMYTANGVAILPPNGSNSSFSIQVTPTLSASAKYPAGGDVNYTVQLTPSYVSSMGRQGSPVGEIIDTSGIWHGDTIYSQYQAYSVNYSTYVATLIPNWQQFSPKVVNDLGNSLPSDAVFQWSPNETQDTYNYGKCEMPNSGITYDGNGNQIGTPNAAQSYNVSYAAQDDDGCLYESKYVLKVHELFDNIQPCDASGNILGSAQWFDTSIANVKTGIFPGGSQPGWVYNASDVTDDPGGDENKPVDWSLFANVAGGVSAGGGAVLTVVADSNPFVIAGLAVVGIALQTTAAAIPPDLQTNDYPGTTLESDFYNAYNEGPYDLSQSVTDIGEIPHASVDQDVYNLVKNDTNNYNLPGYVDVYEHSPMHVYGVIKRQYQTAYTRSDQWSTNGLVTNDYLGSVTRQGNDHWVIQWQSGSSGSL